MEIRGMKIAVLCGGVGGEREVSLLSGETVINALRGSGASVSRIDPSDASDLQLLISEDFDLAFLALHGEMGEDGSVQGLLDVLSIPYTGSGVWASSTAMDKQISKLFYEQVDLSVPLSIVVSPGAGLDVNEAVAKVGLPCMVKPVAGGSSLGLAKALTSEELESAVRVIHDMGASALIEQLIDGEVFTVGVLDDGQLLTALPIVWLDFEGECDYEAKYGDTQRLRHVCPAPNLTEEEVLKLQEQAKLAHLALRCAGATRSDFIRDSEGVFWILETNTIPGMTATSSLPTAAGVAGITYPELCEDLALSAVSGKDR